MSYEGAQDFQKPPREGDDVLDDEEDESSCAADAEEYSDYRSPDERDRRWNGRSIASEMERRGREGR